MKAHGSMIPLIEAAYENVGLPRDAWLAVLRKHCEGLFDGVIDSCLAWEFDFDSRGSFRTLGVSADEPFRSSYYVTHALMPKGMWQRGHLENPVPTLLGALGGDARHPAYRALNRLGVWEMAGAVGADPGGQGVVLAWFRRRSGPLPPGVRHSLERIAAHIARAVRLRNGRGSPEDAVMSGDGSLLHAEHDARDPEARQALQAAARRIERARLRTTPKATADEALDLWNALVEGQWSLVERTESDGRRILVARRNEPTPNAARALNRNERKVAALLALGHNQKLIAYELGYSESSVSKLARSGLSKLGVSSRAELVELYGAVVSTSEDVD